MNTILQEYSNNIESYARSVNMASNVLVVDEKDKYREKVFTNIPGVESIVTTNDITKVKTMLSRDVNGLPPFEILVISALFVDKAVKEKELEEISDIFAGSIIVRCDTDEIGLRLIKLGLATDYYISNEQENENLHRAVESASIRKRCLDRLYVMHQKLNTLESLKKVLS